MNDCSLGIDDEYATSQDLQLFNQHSPILSETAFLIVATDLQVGNAFGATESIHGERQVQADRQGIDAIAEFPQFIVEFLGLGGTNGCIQ